MSSFIDALLLAVFAFGILILFVFILAVLIMLIECVIDIFRSKKTEDKRDEK